MPSNNFFLNHSLDSLMFFKKIEKKTSNLSRMEKAVTLYRLMPIVSNSDVDEPVKSLNERCEKYGCKAHNIIGATFWKTQMYSWCCCAFQALSDLFHIYSYVMWYLIFIITFVLLYQLCSFFQYEEVAFSYWLALNHC